VCKNSRQGDEIYDGQHDAIVDDAVWQQAQEVLAHRGRTNRHRARNKHGALLRDLLRCTPCDAPMGHSFTVKGVKRYRYYVCNEASKHGWGTCPSKSIPAAEIERFVVDRIRAIGSDADLLAATLAEARAQHEASVKRLKTERASRQRSLQKLTLELERVAGSSRTASGISSRRADLHERIASAERDLAETSERLASTSAGAIEESDLATALSLFDPVWDALFPNEQARVLRLLVERVAYDGGAGTLAITFWPSGIRALADEVGGGATEEVA